MDGEHTRNVNVDLATYRIAIRELWDELLTQQSFYADQNIKTEERMRREVVFQTTITKAVTSELEKRIQQLESVNLALFVKKSDTPLCEECRKCMCTIGGKRQ